MGVGNPLINIEVSYRETEKSQNVPNGAVTGRNH